MYRKIKNPDDWKACPFCGHKELEREPSTGDIACNVCAYTFYDTSEDNSWWNSRPIEDALRAENERLKMALDNLITEAELAGDYRIDKEYIKDAKKALEVTK